MRATSALTVISLTLTTAVGCTWPTSTSIGPQDEPGVLPIFWEKAGSYCTRTLPLRLVARSRAEMALCPVADVPVDFNRQMVLVAAMGRVTSDRYAIRIHRVWREGSVIKVDVRTSQGPQTTQPSIRMTSPYHVIVVPRSDLNIEGFSPDPRRAVPRRARGLPLGF